MRLSAGTSIYALYLEIEQIQKFITIVRNLRGERNLSPASKIPLIIETKTKESFAISVKYVKILAKVSEISFVERLDDNQTSPIAIESGSRFMLQVEIDPIAEKIRLSKEIEKQTKELEKMQSKLDNPNYVDRAPVDLVARDKARTAELSAIITQLELQLNKLS